jgi:hypothetical protein
MGRESGFAAILGRFSYRRRMDPRLRTDRPGPPAAAGGRDRARSPREIRELEGRVWDLTRNLVHPAFVYAALQVAFWCALERNPAFRGAALSFLERSAIHAVQFLGAWAVFYGTLLRDMQLRTRVVTVLLWLAVIGIAAAWLWPAPDALATAPALRALLVVELAAAAAGWVVTMVTWVRAKARHVGASAEDRRE